MDALNLVRIAKKAQKELKDMIHFLDIDIHDGPQANNCWRHGLLKAPWTQLNDCQHHLLLPKGLGIEIYGDCQEILINTALAFIANCQEERKTVVLADPFDELTYERLANFQFQQERTFKISDDDPHNLLTKILRIIESGAIEFLFLSDGILKQKFLESRIHSRVRLSSFQSAMKELSGACWRHGTTILMASTVLTDRFPIPLGWSQMRLRVIGNSRENISVRVEHNTFDLESVGKTVCID